MLRAEGMESLTVEPIEPAARSDPAGALAVFVNHSDGPAGQSLLRSEMLASVLAEPEQSPIPIGASPNASVMIFEETQHQERHRRAAFELGDDAIFQPVQAAAPGPSPDGPFPALEDRDDVVAA